MSCTHRFGACALACAWLVLTACASVCPDAAVGKIRVRVAGQYQKQPTDTAADAQLKAGLDFLDQARTACEAGPAKDCPGATCPDRTPPLRCTIQPGKAGPPADPEALRTLNVGDGYLVLPVAKEDEEGQWFFECACNCTP